MGFPIEKRTGRKKKIWEKKYGKNLAKGMTRNLALKFEGDKASKAWSWYGTKL